MNRGFGRPFRRMFGPDIPPLLQRANQMMANGKYVEAASAFEQLARAAEGARRTPCSVLLYPGRPGPNDGWTNGWRKRVP